MSDAYIANLALHIVETSTSAPRRLHHERARLRLPEILAGVFVFILLPYGLWWVA